MPMGFLGPSLMFMMVYVWSRNFPTTNVSLMGLVRVFSLCTHTLRATSALLGMAHPHEWASHAHAQLS